MTIGDRIKARRKALGMSQDELSELTGANRVTISQYENGKFLPSVPALQRIADALGTTPGALTGENDNEDEKPKTKEARIISGGIDRLPKEQREQALNVMRVMFAKYAEYFEEKGQNE